MGGHMILAAGTGGNLSIPPLALVFLCIIIYFVGRAHGKG